MLRRQRAGHRVGPEGGLTDGRWGGEGQDDRSEGRALHHEPFILCG